MLDEWCERQVDRLCEVVPAYVKPRMTCFAVSPLGWHLCLLAGGALRRVTHMFHSVQWMEEEKPPVLDVEAPEEDDPAFAALSPQLQQEIREWRASQKDWEQTRRAIHKKSLSPRQRFAEWRAESPERARRSDERWAKRRKESERRAQARMARTLPRLMPVVRCRFAAVLLLTMLALLGVLATGSGDMAFLAAACCALWLCAAFETDYAPVCGGVRQRHLAATLARAGSFLMLLPAFFRAYVRRGVQSNVVLQCAMLAMLFAHAALFLALVAFNGRQPLLLRALAGVCGVLPALTAAAAIALAATLLARPMPLPAAGICCAAGAMLAFCADRLTTLSELGGIRLRYGPVWVSAFTVLGWFLMILGAWLMAMPAV